MNNLKRELIHEMGDKNLEPRDDLIFDGQPHEYEAYTGNKLERALYSAIFHPLEDDPNGPGLVAWYGLINNKNERYTYSSLADKK